MRLLVVDTKRPALCKQRGSCNFNEKHNLEARLFCNVWILFCSVRGLSFTQAYARAKEEMNVDYAIGSHGGHRAPSPRLLLSNGRFAFVYKSIYPSWLHSPTYALKAYIIISRIFSRIPVFTASMRTGEWGLYPYLDMVISDFKQPISDRVAGHVTLRERSGGGVERGAEVKTSGQETAHSV